MIGGISMNEPLYQQLCDAGGALLQIQDKRKEALSISKSMEAEEILLNESAPKPKSVGILWIPLILFLNIIGIVIGIYLSKHYSKEYQNNLEKHAQLRKDFEARQASDIEKINKVEEATRSLEKFYAPLLEFLPQKCQNIKAVAIMLEAVHDEKANTLEEAIRFYEDRELQDTINMFENLISKL